jgi:hypothetical protein
MPGTATAARVERMKNEMRPDQIAQLAVALAAPAAAHVSGQIFGARSDEISLYSQPRMINRQTMLPGWTPTSIIETAASTALPPWEGMSAPACAVDGCPAATPTRILIAPRFSLLRA